MKNIYATYLSNDVKDVKNSSKMDRCIGAKTEPAVFDSEDSDAAYWHSSRR